jgi:hypothetical protein
MKNMILRRSYVAQKTASGSGSLYRKIISPILFDQKGG